MNRLMIKMVVGAVALCVIGLYSLYDRSTNYQKTLVTVTQVEETCYMKKTRLKESWTTKEGPCDIVQAVHETHPEFEDYSLKRSVYVAYEYQSPADGNWHRGKHKQKTHDDGRAIKRGDELVVLLHKSKPDVTKKF